MGETKIIEWPVEIGHHYIELADDEKIGDPTHPGEWIFGPARLSWTIHRDGIEVREQ
jgi:hypothetical protein